jgi:uncharacterized protein YaiI (UPF0178 family)
MMWLPTNTLVELVVRTGFGAADDYIAEVVGPKDIIITADITLAARWLAADGHVVDPRSRAITDGEIGHLLGMRELNEHLGQVGEKAGGPSPMSAKDRSQFLSRLDEVVNAVRPVEGIGMTQAKPLTMLMLVVLAKLQDDGYDGGGEKKTNLPRMSGCAVFVLQ